jgi:fructose-1-phosphate kinase PfkB-like protein
VIAELYAVPPSAFTRERNAKAAALAKARHADEARAVKQLRRPSPSLWAANQLARAEPTRLAAFLEAVDRLRATQLRTPRAAAETAREHREHLNALVQRAGDVLHREGYRLTPALTRRISDTLFGAAADEAHAVCFGTLAQRSETSRAAIRTLLASAAPNSLRILDVNLRQHFYSREIIEQSLGLANILKVNETELPLIAAMFEVSGGAKGQISQLAARFQLRVVACTRGARGSLLMAGERWSDHPGVPTEVVDAVGAGDAFTAAMTLGLLAGWNLDDINQRANEVAAFVASRAGATPELPERLRAPFRAK